MLTNQASGDSGRHYRAFADMLDRAQRYQLATPFRYRTLGESEWRAGVTVNLSRSGVLFVAEQPVAPGMAVEIWFTLPPASASMAGAQVVGSGFIVRADQGAEQAQLAIRFHHYNMARGNAPS